MNHASVLTSYSRRSFFVTLLFSILLAAIAVAFAGFQKGWQSAVLIEQTAVVLFILFFGLLEWLFLRNALVKVLAVNSAPATPERKATHGPEMTQQTRQAERTGPTNREKRLFVHLFSVFQREGRLLDFFNEDLSQYEDEQIGAAVRAIHENCCKTMQRYLDVEPVLPKMEGETVTIAAGFDPQAVKLTGNVVGEPPFSGILRHRGWQLRSLALPDLSDDPSATIIAPAEIEVQ